jgi:hypothetical protein
MKPEKHQLKKWLHVSNGLLPLQLDNELDWELREYVVEARIAIVEMVEHIRRLQEIEKMLRASLEETTDFD